MCMYVMYWPVFKRYAHTNDATQHSEKQVILNLRYIFLLYIVYNLHWLDNLSY